MLETVYVDLVAQTTVNIIIMTLSWIFSFDHVAWSGSIYDMQFSQYLNLR